MKQFARACGMAWSGAILCLLLAACKEEPNQKTVETPVRSLPADPRKDCPKSRARLYGECLDQRDVLANALAIAEQENKTVLVSFGAEWCVWCHLLDRHLKGETMQRFDYTYDGQEYLHEEPKAEADATAAKALASYVADNFVLAHIDSDNAHSRQPEGGTGWDVLKAAGADGGFEDWIPYVFAVDRNGQFTTAYDARKAEKSDKERGYRGYDRRTLLDLARQIRNTAQR